MGGFRRFVMWSAFTLLGTQLKVYESLTVLPQSYIDCAFSEAC